MPTETETFRWTEAYSVNVAKLDEQHRRLFNTVNELNRALVSGEGSAVLDPVLARLVEYATEHFDLEETLMEQHRFPGLSTHRTQHKMFREKVGKLLEEHKNGRTGVPVSLMLFLQAWLKQHVMKTDKQYTGFLNARGVK